MVYTHPLGAHGHAAGPAIGMWDKQGGVPGAGDYPVRDGTCNAIELSITVPVEEWGGSPCASCRKKTQYSKTAACGTLTAGRPNCI